MGSESSHSMHSSRLGHADARPHCVVPDNHRPSARHAADIVAAPRLARQGVGTQTKRKSGVLDLRPPQEIFFCSHGISAGRRTLVTFIPAHIAQRKTGAGFDAGKDRLAGKESAKKFTRPGPFGGPTRRASGLRSKQIRECSRCTFFYKNFFEPTVLPHDCPTISSDSRVPLLRAWACRCVTTTSH